MLMLMPALRAAVRHSLGWNPPLGRGKQPRVRYYSVHFGARATELAAQSSQLVRKSSNGKVVVAMEKLGNF